MSRRHQASRRRSYGRRLHELHERAEPRRTIGVVEPDDETRDPTVRVGLLAADRTVPRLAWGLGD